MKSSREPIHGQWSSRWAFVLAATGSAVGLGNIWKFPYITGENGGGAFVLLYLVCIVLIGIPIMMAEIMLGRRGRRSPINTMRHLAQEEGRHGGWRYLGWLGILSGFLILSYYSVIAGWALAYLVRTAGGVFTGLTADGVNNIFYSLVADPERLLAWHTVFMVMTMVVVARGVRSGLERAVRYLMPLLLVLLLVLVGYAMNTGAFQQSLVFLFSPDFSKLTPNSVLIAMGHAFFTLSLGMGAIMVYGSYLPRHVSITHATFTIAGADTLVALLAGMAIFPIVFANGLTPGAGPGLIFQTLPIAFGRMPGGEFFGALFFLLLIFAAWTSAISLIEPLVAYMVENMRMNRVMASALAGGVTWVLGLGTIFSFNLWSGERYKLWGLTFFDVLDYLTVNIMLPLGGLLIAVFAVWAMRRESSISELGIGNGPFYRGWRFVARYITPVAVLLIFLHAIGVLKPWLNRL
ncbi:MAG: sodium-dependent transporter [Gammaproteobacteria bacterium HGW-Gammaproteobacteria-1]|jgi:NSS family neurotransmitter:Na+ symporter|nr:MAG: sodium-dependent transporter [Gammaproteobacteria bacterium HGW-Gammaproteobacteria-1]